MNFALVIGAGPSGLMAAEALADQGLSVIVAEGKPTPSRKFLMAGKSGLNVTKDEPRDRFARAYSNDLLAPMLSVFGPEDVAEWCRDLGQEVFTGSSGRVFPVAMKASPLLRAWLRRLSSKGVDLRTRWQWRGWQGEALRFATPEGVQDLHPSVTVLALGGASWSRLGSDAAWVPWLKERGVDIVPFRPANMGFSVAWTPFMAPFFGQPIKGVALRAGDRTVRGEFVLSHCGVEGSAIYALSAALRDGAVLRLNLMPDVSDLVLEARIARLKRSDSLGNRLRKLGLSPPAAALVAEFGRNLPLQQALTDLTVPLCGPRPMDEAISVAGGIAASSLTEGLELKSVAKVFACGEMLDWEAPTGGYLLTGCWASGLWAGQNAARSVGA